MLNSGDRIAEAGYFGRQVLRWNSDRDMPRGYVFHNNSICPNDAARSKRNST